MDLLRASTSNGKSSFSSNHLERPSLTKRRNAEGVEVEQPNEKEKIQAVSDQFNRFQMMSVSHSQDLINGFD
jgi:hypothetical protein